MALMKVRSLAEWSLVSLGILGLWIISSVPIVLIFTSPTYTGNSSLNIGLNSSGCDLPRPYTNGVCFNIFTEVLNSSGCQANQTQFPIPEHNEVIARAVIEQLNNTNPSEECYEKMLPFICLYWLGLCSEEGELLQPTAGQCEELQFRTCAREWEMLETQSGVLLPDCDMFPDNQSFSCPLEEDVTDSRIKATNVACQDNFYFDEDFQACVPSCQTWSEHGESTTTTLRVTVLASTSIGIILSVITVVVSIVKYKQMFQFPTIFLVFSSIDIMFIDLSVLSRAFFENCFDMQRMVLNYCIVQLFMWWVFHLSVIFWGMWFPFQYNKYKSEGKLRRVSLSLIVAGMVAPFLTIVITLIENAVSSQEIVSNVTPNLGYFVYNHLPIFCTPSDAVSLYTYILPITVTLEIGGPLIILILYRFHKERNMAGSTDLKLMLVMCYYVLLLFGNMAEFTTIGVNTTSLIQSTLNYFYCESRGLNPYHPCPRDFDQYNVTTSTAVVLVILALYPLYVLLFAVNIQKLWKSCQRKPASSVTKHDNSVMVSEDRL